jgi:hypothetical protein
MKKITALLLPIFVFSFSLTVLVQKAYAYDYYITPDFPDGISIPVNVESTLTATLKRYDGTIITQSITVYVQFQWESRPTPYSSEVNTGKVYIKVTPTTTGSKSVTFSSDAGLFASVTSTVNCVPGITVEIEGTKAQFIDPISHKDILLKIRAKETAAWSYVTVVTTKEVSKVIYPSNAPSGTILTPTFTSIESGVYELDCDINNDFLGTYTLTVKVTYMDYYPIPANFTVDVKTPVVSAKYSFQTGESIIITPGVNTGQSVDVKPGCSYFDIEFSDARNNPINIALKDLDIEIETPSGTIFSRSSGYISAEQLTSNKIRAYFTLVESWYVIRLKHLSGGVIIGSYVVPLTEDTVKVATVSTGFNIWDFITNPWVMIPLGVIILALIIKVTGKKREKEE